jgi:hypothetical protein
MSVLLIVMTQKIAGVRWAIRMVMPFAGLVRLQEHL